MKNFPFEKITVYLAIMLLVKLSYTGELNFLIHPRYFWLVYCSIGILSFVAIFENSKSRIHGRQKVMIIALNFFMIAGLFINFQPLTSFAQGQKVASSAQTSTINYGRSKRLTSFSADTEDRSLQDWVTIFNINPEPTKYEGQPIKVKGFYFIGESGQPQIARYTLNCCAADARIISINLAKNLNHPENTWLEISGKLQLLETENGREIAIDIQEEKVVPTPSNPYIVD